VSQITPLVQSAPTAAPFMLKILQWAGAAFATSGGVETLFDNYIRAVEKQLTAPQPPNPEVLKAQAEAAGKDKEIQAKQGLAQFDAASKERLTQIENTAKERIEQLNNTSKERIAKMQGEIDLKIAGIKQTEMFGKEAEDLTARELELEAAQRDLKRQNEADQMQIQHILDSAMLEVKGLAKDHQSKVNESIMKAQVDQEKKKAKDTQDTSKGDVVAAQKMHKEIIESVGQVMEALKGMGGKKSISITLPDGKQASAEVTTQKE